MLGTVPEWDAIGEAARGRFPSWDAELWEALGRGPFASLASALGPEDPAVVSYARLAAEAVGHGYLYPERSGARGFLSHAWQVLLPAALASLPPVERARSIAMCWNLGENLEAAPTWLKRLFEARLAGATLADLEERVRSTSELVFAPAQAELGESPERAWQLEWLHLGAHDPLFLPGAVCFLAPVVACVRSRDPRGVDRQRALAISIADRTEVLGPVEWPASPARHLPSDAQLAKLRALDRRTGSIHDAAIAGGRLIASLATSQYVLVVRPAP
ncbi:MAG: hypothetical protein IT378_22540 [Sandaracinaceae bacterium]|nr:hypothetical protein [Sandaracinaceae bacterium]